MKNGFTLSEVLVTLGIIGVVAALTLPAVITNYQKQATVTKLKKAYSEMYQAVNLSINDNDVVENWDFNLDNEQFVNKYILPYMKTTGYQKNKESLGRYLVSLNNGTEILFAKHRSSVYPISISVQVYLNGYNNSKINGKNIFYFYIYPQKSNAYNSGNGTEARKIPAGGFYYDGYGMSRNELISDYYRGCKKEITYGLNGSHCTGLIILDGWKISDDYPW